MYFDSDRNYHQHNEKLLIEITLLNIFYQTGMRRNTSQIERSHSFAKPYIRCDRFSYLSRE
ncbi:hypothetical protein [Coleofasciculus sp. FACHB-129]|uniref:hypothetical protein n=1 Tax=Coleofasciculus sp. FACHB-129 TaxID=2692785 RepID=UPI0016892D77|nr:hypothetical protein [Coleofasciculus sp. FACHB-129]